MKGEQMGEKDTEEKLLADYNDVFADIVNVLLFNGERVVSPDDLENTKDRSQYKADNVIHEEERDATKEWKKTKIRLAIFGLENQTDVDEDMVLRVLGYDGAAYRKQLLDGKNKAPVVTLVLYFGERHWKKARSLYECIDVPEKMRPYVNDYRINVFEIGYLTRKQVEMFQSDFKIVADYFVQKTQNKEYKPGKEHMKHVDEVLKLLKVLTGDYNIEEQFKENIEGVDNMQGIFSTWLEQGRKQGKAEGIAEGEFCLMYRIYKNVGDYRMLKKVTGCSDEKLEEYKTFIASLTPEQRQELIEDSQPEQEKVKRR
jgi:hypothetical protein